MDPAYGERYADLYHRHWWWRIRENAIMHELRRFRPTTGWRRLLDVGSGDGLLFPRLAEFGEVEGVEPEAALIAPDSPWRDKLHVVPFDDQFQPGHRYDVILFLDVLEHLDEPAKALRHAASLLEPNGIVLVTVPAFMTLWTTHDDLNYHRRRYDRQSMRALMRESGFRLERERFLFQWLFGAKLAVKAVEAIRHPQPAPPRVPPAPINTTLKWISASEEWMGRRVHAPFGNSLLVVARPAA